MSKGLSKQKFSLLKTTIFYLASDEQREQLRLWLNEWHDKPGRVAPDLLQQKEELQQQLDFATNLRARGIQVILDDAAAGNPHLKNLAEQRTLEAGFSRANNDLTETLTSIKDAALTLDIPQARGRAIELLKGKDKELDDRWGYLRKFILAQGKSIPDHIPAVIAARKEATAVFLETNGRQWRPLWDHIHKTADFGLDQLPSLSKYNNGGSVNGRVWLAKKWFAIRDDEANIAPGGIWARLFAELEAENLPEYDSGLLLETKKKIRALDTLKNYGRARAGELEGVLRRELNKSKKITPV